MKVICTLFLMSLTFFLNAQSGKTDSLHYFLNNGPNDSNKVNKLLQYSKQLFGTHPESAKKYAEAAIRIASDLHYEKGIALGFKNKGICYYVESKYFDAIMNWNKALQSFKKINDKVGEANILSNLGAVYFNQADDIKALDYYLQSLKLAEEINDSLRLATVLMNIGGVYHNKKATNDKALEYFFRALPISEAIKDNDAIGTVNVNIGEIYFETAEYEKALKYLQKSVEAYAGSENIPYSYITIGKVYTKQKKFEKAIENLYLALEISKKLNSQLDIARSELAIADAYKEKGEIEKSIEAYLRGINTARSIKANIELKSMYQGIAEVYQKRGDFNNAYTYQTLLLDIKDSLYNNETDKKLSGLMFNYEIDKKENKINLLTKDKQIQDQVIKRQKLVRNSFIAGFLVVMGFAGIFFRQRNKISKEKQRSEKLLLNILPEETAEELKATGAAKAKSFNNVTVLFTDFKDFTKLAESLSPEKLVEEINDCFSVFDRIMEKYGIEKIKTIGDAYMAAGGLPTQNDTHASDVIKAAMEIKSFMFEHKEKKATMGESSFGIRIGIHSGPVVAGIVGVKKFQYDIWGDTVNTASRMESSGEVGKVNISGATYQLVKDEFDCIHRGKIDAKNKGQIDMYFVEAAVST